MNSKLQDIRQNIVHTQYRVCSLKIEINRDPYVAGKVL